MCFFNIFINIIRQVLTIIPSVANVVKSPHNFYDIIKMLDNVINIYHQTMILQNDREKYKIMDYICTRIRIAIDFHCSCFFRFPQHKSRIFSGIQS